MKKMKSVLLIGQSNMAGRGFLNEVRPICNENIFMLRNGRWQMMAEPVHFDRPVAGVGPAASFAQAWCDANQGQQIGLIPCAEGGSSLDEWAVGGTLFRHAVSEAEFAMENSELIAVLWHQGESDSHSGKYQEYDRKLDEIVHALREKLGAWEIPFILGGLADFLGKSAFGLNCTEYTEVNAKLRQYAKNHENCYYVTGEQLFSNPDGIHINAESQRRFGIRYFEAFQKRADIDQPLEEEAERVKIICEREYTMSEQRYLAMQRFARGKLTLEEATKYLK